MKTIRVGIIGQGRSGWGIHAEFLRTVPELFKIVAVADLIPERVAQSAADLGCRAYPDAESLIADPDMDLVVVSTYNATHAKYAEMALRAGKHVLCEKPFGLTVADVDAMAAALTRLATDVDLRRQLVAKGCGQRSRFSWDITADLLWKSMMKTVEP